MVRTARFSFDDGMHVDPFESRNAFDDDEVEDTPLIESPKPRRPRRRRQAKLAPSDRNSDRRKQPAGDWPIPPEMANVEVSKPVADEPG
ncbi:MAG: hypothetical protein ACKV0T_15010 [Planctomycetales bacterium]